LPRDLVDLARVVGQIARIVEFARQFVGRHVRQFVVGAPSPVSGPERLFGIGNLAAEVGQ
jgi:hypothetical protein